MPRSILPLNRRIAALVTSLAIAPVVVGAQGMVGAAKRDLPAEPLPPSLAVPAIDFADVAREAGLTVARGGAGLEGMRYLPETTGPGLAVVDLDNDGLPDVFLVGTGGYGAEPSPEPNTAFMNRGGLRFEPAGLGFVPEGAGWGQGVCAGDVDGDGHSDLFVTRWGQDLLLRNMVGEGLRDETAERGLAGPTRWSTGCSFLDFDLDGDLDLFVAHYVDFDPDVTPLPGDAPQCEWRGAPIPCGPRGLAAESMSLFENRDGMFVDVSEASRVRTARRYHGLGVLTGDFDGDGWPDVFVACDSTANLLFRNKRDGSFAETGLVSGAAFDEDGREQAGMGVAIADFDGDGAPDLFQTNFARDTNTLYRNRGGGFFRDGTVAAGLATATRLVGWGAEAADFDRDGRPDIFVANGHVAPSVDGAGIGETFAQPRLLFWNVGDGRFHPVSDIAGAGIAASHSSRGSAVGDLDNDGDLEIVVANIGQPPSLLQNRAEAPGNWLSVRVLLRSGADAVGARVTVEAGGLRLVSEVRSGGGYLSQGDFRLHFGLGSAESATVRVRWPSGAESGPMDVTPGAFLTVPEPPASASQPAAVAARPAD